MSKFDLMLNGQIGLENDIELKMVTSLLHPKMSQNVDFQSLGGKKS